MSRIRLYFDEDAMQNALVVALRARRIDVLTASDCDLIGRSDEDQLLHAASEGRVLYSFNIKDFSLLHAHWIFSGRRGRCSLVWSTSLPGGAKSPENKPYLAVSG